MSGIRFQSIAEQVTGHLREELLRGRWSGVMPGKHELAGELGINNKTVESALRRLEADGVLVAQGAGRKRLIRLPEGGAARRSLRVAILLSETADRSLDYLIELRNELGGKGHDVFYAPDSMEDLVMDTNRIIRMAGKTAADAWVVGAGSRGVLEWFAEQREPVIALFGRRRGLPIAGVGPDKPPALVTATQRLIELGHRRIVLLARVRRRLPVPGASEQAFLDALAAHGIVPGPYHLPDWKVTIDGFHSRLESLFKFTPPTALIVDESVFFVAALQFCSSQGLRVPEDVSLVCTDYNPTFAWCKPSVAHIRWDSRPVVRRILRWADNVSSGKVDKRQTLTPCGFVPGGTIGPPRGK